jgi:uncharacterized protein
VLTMSFSLYDVCMPVLVRGLNNVTELLNKAEEYAAQKHLDTDVLAQARLYPDMHPLARQVQIACNTAKGAVARLTGAEVPVHEDTERTLGELKDRVGKTLKILDSVTVAQMNGAECRSIAMKMPPGSIMGQKYPAGAWRFVGLSYVTHFLLPNFYFHVGMVYSLLRKSGVPIGKSDFLGDMSEFAAELSIAAEARSALNDLCHRDSALR